MDRSLEKKFTMLLQLFTLKHPYPNYPCPRNKFYNKLKPWCLKEKRLLSANDLTMIKEFQKEKVKIFLVVSLSNVPKPEREFCQNQCLSLIHI